MVEAIPDLHCLRDPTRGGVAATLNELARASDSVFRLDEHALPLKPDVAAACELIGLDPLYVANEGKLIAFCAPEHADRLLDAMRSHPLGGEAAIIGTVVGGGSSLVEMDTTLGGRRVVDWLNGEQLPRIC
jgi:hydrogenase expression/formation protein HypE